MFFLTSFFSSFIFEEKLSQLVLITISSLNNGPVNSHVFFSIDIGIEKYLHSSSL